MRIERELMRGAGPMAVMKLLERGEMYGYELVEALSKQTDGVLAMGQSTLYPMLYNLEAKKLIASRVDETGPRPRKYYRLTAAGKKRLAQDTEQWRALMTAMACLGVTDPASAEGAPA
ncbi:MAG: PadR family transcriptional regulator [Phycisphaera sp.]|nr:PadR family transcriptional regulator [Phycisphaera sp.]